METRYGTVFIATKKVFNIEIRMIILRTYGTLKSIELNSLEVIAGLSLFQLLHFRIPLFTLIRIWIRIFTLMRLRILIKVMRIRDIRILLFTL
jgi:hypothetical protein